MRKSKQRNEPSWQEASAVVRRAVESALADKRSAAQAAAAGTSTRPESDTDSDLFRFDLAYRLRARICREPRQCANHRCRRLGSCRELLKTGRLREAHRALVAGEAAMAGKPGADCAASPG